MLQKDQRTQSHKLRDRLETYAYSPTSCWVVAGCHEVALVAVRVLQKAADARHWYVCTHWCCGAKVVHCRSNLQISKSKSFTLKVNVLCFWFESSFHSFTAAPSSLQAFVDKSHKSSKQTTANPRHLLAMKVITSVVSYTSLQPIPEISSKHSPSR